MNNPDAVEALIEILRGNFPLAETVERELNAKGFTITRQPVQVSDEKLREAVKELSMAAGIADTFHARNCCAALDIIESAIAELEQLRAEANGMVFTTTEQIQEWTGEILRLRAALKLSRKLYESARSGYRFLQLVTMEIPTGQMDIYVKQDMIQYDILISTPPAQEVK